MIVLIAKVKDNQGSTRKITGVVTDINGEFIIGASILIKGSKSGTITNMNGQFTIEATDKSVLIISYIGYKAKEINVAGGNSVLIKLDEDVEMLGEVVVTALGIKREEKALGYAGS